MAQIQIWMSYPSKMLNCNYCFTFSVEWIKRRRERERERGWKTKSMLQKYDDYTIYKTKCDKESSNFFTLISFRSKVIEKENLVEMKWFCEEDVKCYISIVWEQYDEFIVHTAKSKMQWNALMI